MEIDAEQQINMKSFRKQIDEIENTEFVHKPPINKIIIENVNCSEIEQLKEENRKLKLEIMSLKYKVDTLLFKESGMGDMGEDIFYDAIEKEDIDMLNKFLIHLPDKINNSALNDAIESGKLESVKFFIENGIKFGSHIDDESGARVNDSRIFEKAIGFKYYDVVEYLMDNDPSIIKNICYEYSIGWQMEDFKHAHENYLLSVIKSIDKCTKQEFTKGALYEFLQGAIYGEALFSIIKFIFLHNKENVLLCTERAVDIAINFGLYDIVEFFGDQMGIYCSVQGIERLIKLLQCNKHSNEPGIIMNHKILKYVISKKSEMVADYCKENKVELNELF